MSVQNTNNPCSISVFILAGICLYRQGLANILSGESDIDVVGTAGRSGEALSLLSGLSPNVALVDLSVNGAHDVVQRIVRKHSSTRVAALAVDNVEQNITRFARTGVSGFVTREATAQEVVATVRSVNSGELRCSPKVAGKLLDALADAESQPLESKLSAASKARLTARENQILDLIEQGLSNKEIASRLCIGVSTVKNHVHRVLEKLSVKRRGEAVARVRSEDRFSAHQ